MALLPSTHGCSSLKIMIGKGSFVKYIGEEKKNLWKNRKLMVHERNGDNLVVWDQQKSRSEYTTTTVSVKDVEEIC